MIGSLFIYFNSTSDPKVLFGKGWVTITMDDGTIGQYSYAFPILRARDILATIFLVTSRMEPSRTWYISIAQALEMQSAGWEIGSHSKIHVDLTTLTDQEIQDEVYWSKSLLESWGFSIRSFAYPEGKYDMRVLRTVSQSYSIARGVSGSHQPYDFDSLTFEDRYTELGWVSHKSVAQIKVLIDQAASENKWLVLGFHMFYADGRADECENFTEIADYIHTKVVSGELETVTLIQGWSEWAHSRNITI